MDIVSLLVVGYRAIVAGLRSGSTFCQLYDRLVSKMLYYDMLVMVIDRLPLNRSRPLCRLFTLSTFASNVAKDTIQKSNLVKMGLHKVGSTK